MKRLRLTKVITSLLIVSSVITLNPIGVIAQWKQDSNGWWNSEDDSYSIGWKQIDGKWYYFKTDGYMAHDTTVDGYKLGYDGAWIQSIQNSYEELEKLPQEYSADMAKNNGDVVKIGGVQYNIEKLDKFIENYKNKQANQGDMVRITSYGDKENAIICELIIDNEGIKLIKDNSRDALGSDEDRMKKECNVIDIYKKDEAGSTKYYVKTAQGNEMLLYSSDIH